MNPTTSSDLAHYHPLALRTAKLFQHPVGDLNHALLGIVTEYLEYKLGFGPDNRREELGDLMWYLPLAAQALEMRLNDIFEIHRHHQPMSIEEAIKMMATHVKRMVAYDRPLDQLMRVQIMSAVFSVLAFVSRECDDRGFSLNDVMDENIAKLRKRFPGAFSAEAAEARADKGGLSADVS